MEDLLVDMSIDTEPLTIYSRALWAVFWHYLMFIA